MGHFTKEQYNEAVKLVRESGRAATSFVSRGLGVKYTTAVEIMLAMERNGVVSKANHVGRREVIKCDPLEETETLRTILSLLDSNASRDNIRRVVEEAIGDSA